MLLGGSREGVSIGILLNSDETLFSCGSSSCGNSETICETFSILAVPIIFCCVVTSVVDIDC